MSRVKSVEVIAGSTIRLTFRADGASASPISSALFSGSETLVSSIAAVSSGNGYYYALHDVPSTPAWYVNRWVAFISPNTYRAVQYVRGVTPEVD